MIFLGKGNIHCIFLYLIKPKRRHTSGAVSIRPKYALCTLDGGGGRAEGARVHFGQKRPPLLGPSVRFCGASANFPFHAPRRGGGMPKGQQRILVKKGPHFWALALAFVVQLAASLSAPLEGGRGAHGRRAARREGG